ncbi:hypothetical protein DFH09DRAFT_1317106 [Mycena vulgaris]|nr:hypothetical protein DFH09DRAFT_1317106 [Mycena vulgaris]
MSTPTPGRSPASRIAFLHLAPTLVSSALALYVYIPIRSPYYTRMSLHPSSPLSFPLESPRDRARPAFSHTLLALPPSRRHGPSRVLPLSHPHFSHPPTPVLLPSTTSPSAISVPRSVFIAYIPSLLPPSLLRHDSLFARRKGGRCKGARDATEADATQGDAVLYDSVHSPSTYIYARAREPTPLPSCLQPRPAGS